MATDTMLLAASCPASIPRGSAPIILEDLTSKSSSIGLRRYYICLGALPLLYPAAPPSVFAFGKYTAPAVALGREYVVGFLGLYGRKIQ